MYYRQSTPSQRAQTAESPASLTHKGMTPVLTGHVCSTHAGRTKTGDCVSVSYGVIGPDPDSNPAVSDHSLLDGLCALALLTSKAK